MNARLPRLGAWAAKRMLHHSGLLALARLRRSRERALVLRYHAITDGPAHVPYAGPSICLPVDAFRLQMAFVRRAYRVVPLDELVTAVGRGGKLPPRALAVTFDDGYADNHRLAFPVLQRFSLPATLYVTTGALDGGPHVQRPHHRDGAEHVHELLYESHQQMGNRTRLSQDVQHHRSPSGQVLGHDR